MNRGGENSRELMGVKKSQVKFSLQEGNDLRKSKGYLPLGVRSPTIRWSFSTTGH